MRILFVNDRSGAFGGVEVYINSLRDMLERRGHVVGLVAGLVHGEESRSEYGFAAAESGSARYLCQLFNPLAWIGIRRAIREFRPDLVHIHNIDKRASRAALAGTAGIPTVMTLHDYDLILPGSRWGLKHECTLTSGKYCRRCTSLGSIAVFRCKRLLQAIFLHNVDCFITASSHMLAMASSHGLRPTVRIPYGIQLLDFSGESDSSTVLYVGRVTEEKGVEQLIRSLSSIRKRIPCVNLVIAGTGSGIDRSKELVSKLGLQSAVSFAGFVPHEELTRYYADCAVVAVPSLWPEPFGLVSVEAMSAGRAVVASRVGGIPDLVDDARTGYLVDPGSEIQLADRISELLTNRTLRAEMGKLGREKAERLFSETTHVAAIESTYKTVVSEHQSRDVSRRFPQSRLMSVLARVARQSPHLGDGNRG